MGAQGLHGEVKLMHDSGDEEALRRLTSVFLDLDGSEKALHIEKLRMHKRTPILTLSGVSDRDAAEALIGYDVYADKSESRPDEEDAWLVSDLAGLEVRITPGAPSAPGGAGPGSPCDGRGDDFDIVGPFYIRDVKSNPAHDILEIETSKGVRLLPMIDLFVIEVDIQSGFIVIDPPAGWLE